MENDDMTLLDDDDIMEATLEGIDAAPDFMEPPSGQYLLGVHNAEIKPASKDKKTQITFAFTVLKTVKLADEDADPVPNGSLFGQWFNWTAESKPYLVSLLQKMMNEVPKAPVPEILELLKEEFDAKDGNLVFQALIQTRTNRDGFTNIQVKEGKSIERAKVKL